MKTAMDLVFSAFSDWEKKRVHRTRGQVCLTIWALTATVGDENLQTGAKPTLVRYNPGFFSGG